MADAKELIDALGDKGVTFYTGVPDSLLSKFSACIMQQPELKHIIATNEGNAVGLALGEYLATGCPGVVYMQNSGLGNVVNPLTSLADPAVYAIPMFLVIGWRGEPGVHDEPQHVKQGRITLAQLDVLGVPYFVCDESSDVRILVAELWQKMFQNHGPVALVVRKGALKGEWAVNKKSLQSSIKREEALDCLLKALPESAFYVATTGKTGRELFELRERDHHCQRDFLTVGGMGHASSIALTIALRHPQKTVVCLDGDGAALMHLGAMATIAAEQPKNFIHVLLNNAAHESVGGQPTIAGELDFEKLSLALGYSSYISVDKREDFQRLSSVLTNENKGPLLLEIRVLQGARKELGRPNKTPIQNKESVMNYLKG